MKKDFQAKDKRNSTLAVPAQVIDRSKHITPGLSQMPLAQKLRNDHIYETVLKPLEQENRDRQLIDPKSTLCLFSNPRGGSTWLGEILQEIPDSVLCNESIFRLPEFSELQFTWHQPIPAGVDWPEAYELFRKILNREILSQRVYFTNDLAKIPGAAHHIYKFCHGNLLLEWFADHFDVMPILLVRHPCAVVSSQIQHHGWQKMKEGGEIKYSIPEFRFNDFYFLYEDILKTVKTIEESLAATWCLTMVDSLQNQSNDKKWITVAYENLYTNFEFEIDRIFGRLGLSIPEKVYERNRKVSVSALEYANQYVLSGKQLSNWKDKLSMKQQQNILGIVKAFGITHYDHNPEPDLQQMYVQG